MTNGLRALVTRRAGPAVRSVMVGRIERVQGGRTSAVPDEETLALWYELGRAYAEAGGGGRRAWKLGLTVVCAVGALVLLSAPVFGTTWAGRVAAVVSAAGGGGRGAWALGLTVVCPVGALVLLSAPVFGTTWAGPLAPVIPVAAGRICGGGG